MFTNNNPTNSNAIFTTQEKSTSQENGERFFVLSNTGNIKDKLFLPSQVKEFFTLLRLFPSPQIVKENINTTFIIPMQNQKIQTTLEILELIKENMGIKNAYVKQVNSIIKSLIVEFHNSEAYAEFCHTLNPTTVEAEPINETIDISHQNDDEMNNEAMNNEFSIKVLKDNVQIAIYLSFIEQRQYNFGNEMLNNDVRLQQEIKSLNVEDLTKLLKTVINMSHSGNEYYINNLIQFVNDEKVFNNILVELDKSKSKHTNVGLLLQSYLPSNKIPITNSNPENKKIIIINSYMKNKYQYNKPIPDKISQMIRELSNEAAKDLLINHIISSRYIPNFLIKLIQIIDNLTVIRSVYNYCTQYKSNKFNRITDLLFQRFKQLSSANLNQNEISSRESCAAFVPEEQNLISTNIHANSPVTAVENLKLLLLTGDLQQSRKFWKVNLEELHIEMNKPDPGIYLLKLIIMTNDRPENYKVYINSLTQQYIEKIENALIIEAVKQEVEKNPHNKFKKIVEKLLNDRLAKLVPPTVGILSSNKRDFSELEINEVQNVVSKKPKNDIVPIHSTISFFSSFKSNDKEFYNEFSDAFQEGLTQAGLYDETRELEERYLSEKFRI